MEFKTLQAEDLHNILIPQITTKHIRQKTTTQKQQAGYT